MLLTLSTTHTPATDLGYLLHKNPAARRSVDMWFGQAHVFYPEATDERCTDAVLIDVDPIGLVRRKGRGAEPASLEPYVNDRPYAASSFLSVALAKLFGTAMSGRSSERQDLADTAIPLEVRIPALPWRGGKQPLRRLFEPLGYEVSATPVPLDEQFPEWGAGNAVAAPRSRAPRTCEARCMVPRDSRPPRFAGSGLTAPTTPAPTPLPEARLRFTSTRFPKAPADPSSLRCRGSPSTRGVRDRVAECELVRGVSPGSPRPSPWTPWGVATGRLGVLRGPASY